MFVICVEIGIITPPAAQLLYVVTGMFDVSVVQLIREVSPFLDNEVIQLMLARGVYLIPTLSAPYFIIKGGTEAGIPEFAVHKTKQVIEEHVKSFRAAHQAGVKIAMGTEQGTPFNVPSNIVQEIRLMVENGMSPEEALSSATRVAAEALGLGDQIGTIEPGKYADILALDGDPLSNLNSLENVTWVMKEGKIVYRGYKDKGSS